MQPASRTRSVPSRRFSGHPFELGLKPMAFQNFSKLLSIHLSLLEQHLKAHFILWPPEPDGLCCEVFRSKDLSPDAFEFDGLGIPECLVSNAARGQELDWEATDHNVVGL